MIKVLLINFSSGLSQKLQHYTLHYFFANQIRMSWNVAVNGNLLFKLKFDLGFHQIVLTIPKISPEKLTLTVVEKQHLPDIEKTDPKRKSLPGMDNM